MFVQVGQIIAFDRDQANTNNSKIVFSLADESGLFKIDSGTGKITLDKELDYEASHEHVLSISAQDSGEVPRVVQDTLTVIVSVEDVNDNHPIFDRTAFDTIKLVLASPAFCSGTRDLL